jgi:KUP system potassium uptake protein
MSSETTHAPGWRLSLGALGVVYGDIGTSPPYALRAVLAEPGHIDRNTVYGLTSLATGR